MRANGVKGADEGATGDEQSRRHLYSANKKNFDNRINYHLLERFYDKQIARFRHCNAFAKYKYICRREAGVSNGSHCHVLESFKIAFWKQNKTNVFMGISLNDGVE